MSQWIWAAIGGVGAGFVNGLLGTGGGIVLVFALNGIYKEAENKDVYATTLAITLALSLVSVLVYGKKTEFDMGALVRYGPSAAIGGLLGAYLLDRLNGKIVKKIFGILLMVAGANMAGVF